ncbi:MULTISPECIES: 3-ketoacyl-ACP reductase [unclassified Pedobacter]|jgi:3-oxoacyl-[acyl-carrier protein] reductase|uniref:3-ketoacyl-ACP reductase n=1 Tax=Pedobacter TaxID=84567 RepID=UPI000B4BC919|nr:MULTISPECIES: 3-ketoacyl-ACP reductase [unclassified Pedobacter]MCX2431757.1 3-ketoacyl-ACP reductase [Pedobacter sp. GR22-10]OWK72462.1 3-ketoacyl-ACP reductase [Pedobacter sp. AJM]
MENISGKNAIVTGAGKGIGKAIATALAKEGVNVALVGRTKSHLDELAEELKQYHVKIAVATMDVSDIDSVNHAIETVKGALGFIEILINNAGVGKFGKFLEMEIADWERIIQTNLMGTYYVTRAVVPEMIERQTGEIISISSSSAFSPAAVTSAYSASKAAVNAFSVSLMQEMRKHNIRVTALSPSTTATDMAIDLKLTDGNPDKVMQPEDIAELIIAQLKLNRRVFVKDAAVWSTNP